MMMRREPKANRHPNGPGTMILMVSVLCCAMAQFQVTGTTQARKRSARLIGRTATTAIQLQPVLSGLSSPVFVTNAHDASNRLFIVEQGGVIKVLHSGSTIPTTFMNIASRVLSGGERGLLGLAFHPQYSTNGRFFVNYTRQTDGAITIAEYHVSPSSPDVADTTETPILTIPHPEQANHNGGMIEFGPDGFLYIGTGDGGAANDPPNNAQNINVLLGKILRIDIDNPSGGLPYSSPSSNPFFGTTPGADEIYSYGHRNPFRYSFDRATGQLYVGDVGQGAREEVDIVTLGGNFGWRIMEGSICNPNIGGGTCTPPVGHIPPITEYSHSVGRCSITGGYVYRGSLATFPLGTYIFGDYCTGEIFMRQNGLDTSPVLIDTTLSISSFGEDEAGELYVVDLGGTLSRIVAGSMPPQYQGFLDAAGCGIITGWAWDANQPNSSISVDIYDGTSLIATVPANVFREDLVNAGIGNGFHGFSFTVPQTLKNGMAHTIRARFPGTSTQLGNSPRTINCSGFPANYQGFHDGAGCNTIAGWGWDANDPNNPINVDIYDGASLIATVPAIQYRPDLLAEGIGNGFHGFSFTVPASLKDGMSHSVRVRFPGTTTDLGNTPRTISCSGAAPVYEGVFEVADCNTISGWAWDQNDPNMPINVAIFDGSQLIVTVLAIEFRPDLVTMGIGNGYHAFQYNTPGSLKNGQTHSLSVKFSRSTTALGRSPIAITCP
jgi:glucose/arabinose dehydrogenase